MNNPAQKLIIQRLQRQILDLEGFKTNNKHKQSKIGFSPIEKHFPNQVFPTGTIHEFISEQPENTACTSAFIFGLLSKLHQQQGIYLWIGKQKKIFTPGLTFFGIPPHHIIFINLVKSKDILWATEEALKCKSLSGVISEIEGISFAQSQRLQLTVEKSKVTGFILRTQSEKITATACTARWKITPHASENTEDIPGVGFANWQVQLLKVRNGSTANFTVAWRNHQFYVNEQDHSAPLLSQAIGS
jgi:protein ImuA